MSKGKKQNTQTAARSLSMRQRVLLSGVLLILYAAAFRCWPSYFYTISQEGVRSWHTIYTAAALMCAALTLISILCPFRAKGLGGWILSLIFLLGMAFADHYVAEIAFHSGYNYLHQKPFKFLMNPWLYGMVELLFLMITLNVRLAVECGAVFTALITAVNIYLIEWRGVPLYLTDLVDIQTAGDVAGSYQLTMTQGSLLLILYLIAVFALCRKIWPKKTPYIGRRRWLWRLILIPVCSLVIGYTTYYMVWTKAPNRHGVGMSSFRPIKSYRKNGQIITLVRSAKFLLVEKPDHYSQEAVDKLDEQYPSDSAADMTEKLPNVIVVMNESLSDVQSVGSFETNEDPLRFIHSLKENTVKGSLYVSVFGGHTANTEYEVLTGDAYALCPSGTPYVLYIKNPMASLASYMKSLGSTGNIAMHPNTATNYNRNNVYSFFGFEQFLNIQDFEGAGKIRGLVDDATDLQRIITEYEKQRLSSQDPFFLFTVTMQNHSPFDREYTDVPHTIEITSEAEGKDVAETYLNLARLSDDAFAQLVNYFEQVDEKTVIVMFGDHQPALPNAFYRDITGKARSKMTDEEEMVFFKTPLVIWANYDIQEEDDVKLSANYLQTKIKQVIGLPLTGYDKFLAQLAEKLPIITQNGYFDAAGQFFSVKDTTSPHWDLISDYWNLTYQHLFKPGSETKMFSLAE